MAGVSMLDLFIWKPLSFTGRQTEAFLCIFAESLYRHSCGMAKE